MKKIDLNLSEFNEELETATKQQFLTLVKNFKKVLEEQDSKSQLHTWVARYQKSF